MTMLVRELEARRQVEFALAEALATSPAGVVVLLETGIPVSQLREGVLPAVEAALGLGASLHVVSDELVALVCPGGSVWAGWTTLDRARQPFADAGVPLTVGLSSWPMQGMSVTDVFASAVASLADERTRQQRAFLDDIERIFEGDDSELSWSAGELLSA